MYTAFVPLANSSIEDFGLVQPLYIVSKCENDKIDGQGCTSNIGLWNKLLIIKKNENCNIILKLHNEHENNSNHTLLCCLAGVYRPAVGSCRPEVRFYGTSDPGCSRTETRGRSA